MPRFPSPKEFDRPFYLSARCTNKDWFAIPLPVVWEIMQEQLYFATRAFDVRIHSFVLMPNSFELLMSAPRGNLSGCMRYFMTETSRALLRRCGRINQIYGGRYRPTTIGSVHDFLNIYKYVYRRPVAAGACSRAEEYPYSTLHGLLGQRSLLIPVTGDPALFGGDIEGTLSWLNEAPSPVDWEEVRCALRKRAFKLAHRDSRPSPLESRLL